MPAYSPCQSIRHTFESKVRTRFNPCYPSRHTHHASNPIQSLNTPFPRNFSHHKSLASQQFALAFTFSTRSRLPRKCFPLHIHTFLVPHLPFHSSRQLLRHLLRSPSRAHALGHFDRVPAIRSVFQRTRRPAVSATRTHRTHHVLVLPLAPTVVLARQLNDVELKRPVRRRRHASVPLFVVLEFFLVLATLVLTVVVRTAFVLICSPVLLSGR